MAELFVVGRAIRRALVAGALLGVLGLAGCGDSGPPRPPTASPTPEGFVAPTFTPLPPLPTPFPTRAGAAATGPGPVPTQGAAALEDTPLPDAVDTPGAYTLNGPSVGQPAPDISVFRLDTGKSMQLSEFKGKPIWLNFWATWCPPCRQELPEMQQIYEQQKQTDLVMLGVDVGEDPETVQSFLKPMNLGWTFALDPDNRASFQYTVLALPAHIFIGRDGLIQDTVVSGLTKEAMQIHVQQLLHK